jgi:hypothetical protein
MGNESHRLLGPALEAARRALRDLDDDQIPADLRKVAAHSGSLTTPLALRLQKALDRYDWLREKALEAWPEADPDASGDDGVAAAYLARPPGWVARLESAVEVRMAGRFTAEVQDAKSQLGEAQREAKEARRRLRDARGEAEAELRRLRRAVEEERKARRAVQAGTARAESGAQSSLEALRAELAQRDAELRRLDARSDELQGVLRRERRERAAAEAAAAELAAAGGWSGSDPLTLAGQLDRMADVARAPARVEAGEAVAETALRRPAGIRPDTAAAVEWLLEEAPPATVLVDGYNAGIELAGAGDLTVIRRRLELEVGRLVTLAARRLAVVVVYDSAESEGDPPQRRTGVEVRFSGEQTADDALVELAAGIGGRTIVISGDRAVRERSERVGAVALWSAALREWALRG